MFSYQEAAYHVIDRKVRAVAPIQDKNHLLFELRQADGLPYVSLCRFNHENKPVAQTLLLYTGEDAVRCDWLKIKESSELSISDLNYYKRVEEGIAFLKDGTVNLK